MSNTYFHECMSVADKFIRTVCFIDDQPFFQDVEDPVNGDLDHRLNADLITKAFAAKGKSSTFYKYQNIEEETPILQLVSNSDVTVLDWKIVLPEEEQSIVIDQNDQSTQATIDLEQTSYKEKLATELDKDGDNLIDEKKATIIDNVKTNTEPLQVPSHEEQIPLNISDGEDDIPEDESRGKYAIMLLQKILTQKHGSPKLILIYTAETDYENIFQTILEKLNELKIKHESNLDELWFQNDKTRISIFFKKPSQLDDAHISEQVKKKKVLFSDLPNVVNSEFAKINSGLLSNVALKSLTAIRNETTQILDTFAQIIDPSFLAHRALLPHPDDSEEHILDLIGSEIKSVIKGGEKGFYLSNELVRKYIEGKFEDKEYEWDFEDRDKFNIGDSTEQQNKTSDKDSSEAETNTLERKQQDKSDIEKSPSLKSEEPSVEEITDMTPNEKASNLIIPQKVSREELIKFSEVGVDNIFLKHNTPVHQKILFSKSCHKSLTSLFAKSDDEAKESNNLFAILTTVKSRYNENKPTLTQGTILKNNNEYWICIQPKCDTVRIPKTRGFLLAALNPTKNSSKFDLVIKNDDGAYMYFKIDYVTYKAKYVIFKADPNQKIVIAISENNKFFMGNAPKMVWLGELKSDYAQSISNNFSSYLSRVGMDHSEWLRRSS